MDTIIIKLQETLAHQSEEISRLSEELYIQQKEIAALQVQINHLQAKLETVTEAATMRSLDQEVPPPHY